MANAPATAIPVFANTKKFGRPYTPTDVALDSKLAWFDAPTFTHNLNVPGFRHQCWGLINKPNSERQNQYNSLSLNMAAHMASRGLRMRSFYYGKITNKITTIQTKPYSVKTIYNVHKGVSPLLTMLSIKLFRQTDETNMEL